MKAELFGARFQGDILIIFFVNELDHLLGDIDILRIDPALPEFRQSKGWFLFPVSLSFYTRMPSRPLDNTMNRAENDRQQHVAGKNQKSPPADRKGAIRSSIVSGTFYYEASSIADFLPYARQSKQFGTICESKMIRIMQRPKRPSQIARPPL